MAELEKKLCSGNHKNCRLHITKGGAAEMHIRNAFEALQKEREEAQIAHNRAVFHQNEASNRIAIQKLTEKIQNSVLLYLRPYTVRSESARRLHLAEGKAGEHFRTGLLHCRGADAMPDPLPGHVLLFDDGIYRSPYFPGLS